MVEKRKVIFVDKTDFEDVLSNIAREGGIPGNLLELKILASYFPVRILVYSECENTNYDTSLAEFQDSNQNPHDFFLIERSRFYFEPCDIGWKKLEKYDFKFGEDSLYESLLEFDKIFYKGKIFKNNNVKTLRVAVAKYLENLLTKGIDHDIFIELDSQLEQLEREGIINSEKDNLINPHNLFQSCDEAKGFEEHVHYSEFKTHMKCLIGKNNLLHKGNNSLSFKMLAKQLDCDTNLIEEKELKDLLKGDEEMKKAVISKLMKFGRIIFWKKLQIEETDERKQFYKIINANCEQVDIDHENKLELEKHFNNRTFFLQQSSYVDKLIESMMKPLAIKNEEQYTKALENSLSLVIKNKNNLKEFVLNSEVGHFHEALDSILKSCQSEKITEFIDTLHNIDERSNVYLFIGPSKAGKSTIINSLSGFKIIEKKTKRYTTYEFDAEGYQNKPLKVGSRGMSCTITPTLIKIKEKENSYYCDIAGFDDNRQEMVALMSSICISHLLKKNSNIFIVLLIDGSFKSESSLIDFEKYYTLLERMIDTPEKCKERILILFNKTAKEEFEDFITVAKNEDFLSRVNKNTKNILKMINDKNCCPVYLNSLDRNLEEVRNFILSMKQPFKNGEIRNTLPDRELRNITQYYQGTVKILDKQLEEFFGNLEYVNLSKNFESSSDEPSLLQLRKEFLLLEKDIFIPIFLIIEGANSLKEYMEDISKYFGIKKQGLLFSQMNSILKSVQFVEIFIENKTVEKVFKSLENKLKLTSKANELAEIISKHIQNFMLPVYQSKFKEFFTLIVKSLIAEQDPKKKREQINLTKQNMQLITERDIYTFFDNDFLNLDTSKITEEIDTLRKLLEFERKIFKFNDRRLYYSPAYDNLLKLLIEDFKTYSMFLNNLLADFTEKELLERFSEHEKMRDEKHRNIMEKTEFSWIKNLVIKQNNKIRSDKLLAIKRKEIDAKMASKIKPLAIGSNSTKKICEKDKKFILSVNGGGIKGIVPLIELEWIMKSMNLKWNHDLFDMYAGTSIGSVIVGLLNVPEDKKCCSKFTPSTLLDLLLYQKEDIFVKNWMLFDWGIAVKHVWEFFWRLAVPKYTNKGLIDMSRKYCQDYRLKDLPVKHLIIPSQLESPRGSYYFGIHDQGQTLLRDAIVASASAPTYFPKYKIGNQTFVDGGVMNNNPSRIAYDEMVRMTGRSEDICVLSLGTGRAPPGKRFGTGRFFWGKEGLLEAIEMSMEDTDKYLRNLIPDEKYLYLDPIYEKYVEMDTLDTKDLSYLMDSTVSYLEDSVDEINKFVELFLSTRENFI